MKAIDFWINLLSNVLTIFASSIAIYLFLINRKKISTALNTLLNYSHQLTLSDLKHKVELLNDYTVNDSESKKEVINILNEIEGQINGNLVLKHKLSEQLSKVSKFTTNPKLLVEPKKRSLVGELKESLRHLDVSNFNGNISNLENENR